VQTLAGGRPSPRGRDLLTGGVLCYGVYATSDGRHMAVGALEEKFWHLLCDTLQRPDLKPLHLSEGDEAARVRAELAEIFVRKTRAQWEAVFDTVDCCVTPVLSLDEALDNAQIQARHMVGSVGGMQQFAPPFGMAGIDLSDATPAPIERK